MICAPVCEGPHVPALPSLRLSLLLPMQMLDSTGQPVCSPLQRDQSWQVTHVSMHAVRGESCGEMRSMDWHISCWHKHVGCGALPAGSVPFCK